MTLVRQQLQFMASPLHAKDGIFSTPPVLFDEGLIGNLKICPVSLGPLPLQQITRLGDVGKSPPVCKLYLGALI